MFNIFSNSDNLEYIIFDDYGVWDGVKQIVDELLIENILLFEKFIGINNVPGPNGIVHFVNEGIICKINKKINLKYIEKIKNRKSEEKINQIQPIKKNTFNPVIFLKNKLKKKLKKS